MWLVAALFYAVNYSALLIIVLPATFLFFFSESIEVYFTCRRLSSADLGVPMPRETKSLVEQVVALWLLRKRILNSSLWHYEFLHVRIALVAASLVASGIILSVQSNDPTDFARVGALIALTGLYSTFVGLRHEDLVADILTLVDDPDLTMEAGKSGDTHRPQRLAILVMCLITILGTLIWAYGDIFLQRVVAYRHDG